jgi:hypothetical protein
MPRKNVLMLDSLVLSILMVVPGYFLRGQFFDSTTTFSIRTVSHDAECCNLYILLNAIMLNVLKLSVAAHFFASCIGMKLDIPILMFPRQSKWF